MIRQLKNIVSALMVLVLFLPSAIKLEHHHEHYNYPVKSGKIFHPTHEKCVACSFEYSVFLSEELEITSSKAELLIDSYNNCYIPCLYSDLSNYSFSLRAPPAFANNI